MKDIVTRLKGMEGKLYSVNGNSERVSRFAFNEDSGMISLETDVRTHKFSLTDGHVYLGSFLLVDESPVVVSNNELAVTKSNMNSLKAILMDNISKIQGSRDYIPQAEAINSQVKTIIDLAKTEIMAMKVLSEV